MMTLKWKIRNEVHTKGMTIKIPQSVDYEERNKLCFHSVDLHTENDFCSFSYKCGRRSAVIS